MDIEFDRAKDEANIAKHGVSLARAADMDVLFFADDDGADEYRYRLFGLIDGKPYNLSATDRGDVVRAISLRPATSKETRHAR